MYYKINKRPWKPLDSMLQKGHMWLIGKVLKSELLEIID